MIRIGGYVLSYKPPPLPVLPYRRVFRHVPHGVFIRVEDLETVGKDGHGGADVHLPRVESTGPVPPPHETQFDTGQKSPSFVTCEIMILRCGDGDGGIRVGLR